jgi:NADH dehydrogenase FAD-containing subunit
LAMGARVNTFNTPGVEEHAHFLKVCSELWIWFAA